MNLERNKIMVLCPLTSSKLTSEILLYSLFLFSPSHLHKNDNDNHDPRAHIYGEFCQVGLSNGWGPIFLVLLKLDGCWSCS
jgi:hypothetical protein